MDNQKGLAEILGMSGLSPEKHVSDGCGPVRAVRKSMQAKLLPVDGGKPISITRDLTVVGRERGLCDLVLRQTSVSKLQCLIAKTDGLLFIRDLGSTNGTKVNGQRVTRGALLPGDELAFASVKFHVHLGPGAPSDAELVAHDEQTGILERSAESSREDRLAVDSVDSESDVRFLSDDSAVS